MDRRTARAVERRVRPDEADPEEKGSALRGQLAIAAQACRPMKASRVSSGQAPRQGRAARRGRPEEDLRLLVCVLAPTFELPTRREIARVRRFDHSCASTCLSYSSAVWSKPNIDSRRTGLCTASYGPQSKCILPTSAVRYPAASIGGGCCRPRAVGSRPRANLRCRLRDAVLPLAVLRREPAGEQ